MFVKRNYRATGFKSTWLCGNEEQQASVVSVLRLPPTMTLQWPWLSWPCSHVGTAVCGLWTVFFGLSDSSPASSIVDRVILLLLHFRDGADSPPVSLFDDPLCERNIEVLTLFQLILAPCNVVNQELLVINKAASPMSCVQRRERLPLKTMANIL